MADSWDDDDDDDDDADADSSTTYSEPSPHGHNPNNSNTFPRAPPPTPSSPSGASPRSQWAAEYENPYSPSLAGRMNTSMNMSMSMNMSDGLVSPARQTFAGTTAATGARPEKQTVVAGRLIAGALGVRPPKRSDEQRLYEKSIMENELRRREKERGDAKRRLEEAAKAKAAMWDD